MKKTRCLLCAGILIVFQWALADHFPPSKIAVGKPEHVLAGVNVYGDSIEAVIHRLGKPDKVSSTTNADYPPGSGERSYEWTRNGVHLRVGTEFRTDDKSKKIIESAPLMVDVWGTTGGGVGRTGKGLSLGTKISAIRKVYGPRFQKDRHSVTVQWKDETTLVLDLDKENRIVHMQLLAATE